MEPGSWIPSKMDLRVNREAGENCLVFSCVPAM